MGASTGAGAADADAHGADSGFAQLGLVSAPQQPVVTPEQVPVTALTRRELREREQAVRARPAAKPGRKSSRKSSESASSGGRSRKAPAAGRAAKAPRPVRPARPPRAGGRRPDAQATSPRDAIMSASAVTRSAPPRSPRKRSLRRQVLSKLMTFGAMVGAGLMMVSTSIPANAFLNTGSTAEAAITAPAESEVQTLKMQPVADHTLARDGYTAVSLKEQIFLKYGNRNFSFTNDPNGTIQWPFPIGVPISSGFGDRIAPCSGCSSYHEGVDFTPGIGTAIQAIADGVVSLVRDDTWGLGTHVVIDHHINGQLVQSVYGHMLRGSVRVTVGQEVKVTDEVGQVGSTGASTGAHLHLEIHVNGVQVDPFAWLKANAN
jgi:murein DD-endopeptidase MepM/ murein hydrolase activator NlpD